MIKQCSICKINKPVNLFGKRSLSKDGLRSECKQCKSELDLKTRRTKQGLIAELFHTQKQKSKKRNMCLPDYNIKSLTDWVLSQNKFHILYENWKENDYSPDLRPSIDRICDYKPYTFNNIQIMTWKQNQEKAVKDAVSGKTRKTLKPIVQLSLNNKPIKEYYSISQASRELSINLSSIVNCLKGRYKTSGGFKWKYL
jgi:hypothetical protein